MDEPPQEDPDHSSAVIDAFRALYGTDEACIEDQSNRYQRLIGSYRTQFASDPRHLFSAPGRTEIGGNHTDHNRGRVIAAAIHLDTIAAVGPTANGIITVCSEGYSQVWRVDLSDLAARESETGTSAALVRGVAARFHDLGHGIGGFDAFLTSRVSPGSGLSSSAAFEVLIGHILNTLYNHGAASPIEIARIGQYSENQYFGKPCGLMDQIACAMGGAVAIDFADPDSPMVERLPLDLHGNGYRLVIVHTGGSHADLSADYASVPREMHDIARVFGRESLRGLSAREIRQSLPRLRQIAGDRSVLRALHFIGENSRVQRQVEAIRRGDFRGFITLVNGSGQSSQKWLQNSFPPARPQQQGVTLALYLTEEYLEEIGEGACRVHGGGFAGTIQAFLPRHSLEGYRDRMEPVFGPGAVTVLDIRAQGVVQLA